VPKCDQTCRGCIVLSTSVNSSREFNYCEIDCRGVFIILADGSTIVASSERASERTHTYAHTHTHAHTHTYTRNHGDIFALNNLIVVSNQNI